VYKTVSEPIQQNTAVQYHSRLRWTSTNPVSLKLPLNLVLNFHKPRAIYLL